MTLVKRCVVIFAAPLFWFTMGAVFILAIIPVPPTGSASDADKAAHVFAFAVLTTLAVLAYRQVHWTRIFWALIGFGALIECVQMIPALGRDAEWMDLVADGAAVAVMLLFINGVRHFASR